MISFFSFIVWSPKKEIFVIPGINHPVVWYGLLFAMGFVIGQQILAYMFKKDKKPAKDVEQLTLYMVVATLIGARLGHVLFYEPARYFSHPLDIFKVWEGGLASHGAAVAILIALYLYSRKKSDQSYLWVLDRLVILVALGGFFIRMGNMVNSEIIGKPTNSEYGVVFGRQIEEQLLRQGQGNIEDVEAHKGTGEKVDGNVPVQLTLYFNKSLGAEQKEQIINYVDSDIKQILVNSTNYQEPHIYQPKERDLRFDVAQVRGQFVVTIDTWGISRHPAQLYESINCLLLFILLFYIWVKYHGKLREGLIFAIFLIELFGFRFIDEFFKENQVDFENTLPLNMGQWLSIPLVLAGIILLIYVLRQPKPQGTGS